MPSTLPPQVLKQLTAAQSRLAKANVLVGFDGFLDTILHVVDKRESAAKFTRMAKMGTFAKRIDAAAGFSANFEFVTQMVKLGGNGPIMANAMGTYGTPVTYVGALGAPVMHPVFGDFAKRAKVYSISDPGFTDAIEFDDGKLMCGKHESLKQVNWANLVKHIPEDKLLRIFSDSTLVALVNWTMLPFMSQILQKVLTRIAPKLKGAKRWLFFDLADPAKRTAEDISALLKMVTKFESYFHVILGLNLQEGRQIGGVLGFNLKDESFQGVTKQAADIREALGIHTVVIHPTSFAAAADATGATHVVGPFTPKPKITTGAGDHFNAGFCIGRLLDLDLAASLQIGVATSGYYVRNAKSPSLGELKQFLKTL
ncbi:MAG TPA: PfkB family carbohydrate kinase [Chthoniobacteraceae bacterium]|jgi:sugar/nucleoside kinase (ribokinase family)|nr:PfkB family carbohydrate kinase [Chthoniobacteraceae bacterium]